MIKLILKWLSTGDPSRKFRAELDLMYWGRNHARFFRKYFQRRIFYKYNCDISHLSYIHPSVVFPHPSGVVIGSKARVGAGCRVYQQVTIGSDFSDSNRMANVCNNVVISAGAKLIGGIDVGSGSVIGANAVVTKNVAPRSIVVGANRLLG